MRGCCYQFRNWASEIVPRAAELYPIWPDPPDSRVARALLP
jgi:hypothetical protein